MIRRHEPWGTPAGGPPDAHADGGDEALAAAVRDRRGARVRFRPSPASDIARAVGIPPGAGGAARAGGESPTVELAMDAIVLGDGTVAVNMVVFGTPPDRLRRFTRARSWSVAVDGAPWFSGPATGVVVANGQFLRGLDVVPRGHPGDGRIEVQVYGLDPGERRLMRPRLGSGTHVPHPRILQRTGRSVTVTSTRNTVCEVDGRRRAAAPSTVATVVPEAYRLLV